MKKQTIVFGLLVVAGCLIWLWPVTSHVSAVPFWPDSEYSDLLVSHFPNAVMVNTSLEEYKQVPFWNPTSLSGTPANADPLVGLWYPPRWITFLIPTIAIFNLLLGLHFIWAAVGVYRLARLEGASTSSSLIGGILYAGMPKLMTHMALGHIDLLFALSWIPWVIAALRFCMLRIADGKAVRWPAVWFGVTVGMLFLADPRWLIPAGLLILSYTFLTIYARFWKQGFTGRRLSRMTLTFSISALVAACTAAPLALPLIQYTSLSTRRLMTLSDQLLFSFPPIRAVSLFLPFNDVPEWVAYLGAALSLLWLAGMVLRSRPAREWGLMGVFFLLLALGPATPLFSLINGLPGFQLLRVPARFLSLVVLAASIGAAHGIDKLVQNSQVKDLGRKLNLTSVALGVVSVGLAVVFFIDQADGEMRIVQVLVSVAGALVLILARSQLQKYRRLYPVLWFALVSLDLLWMNSTIVEAREMDVAAHPQWLEQVNHVGWGECRVFSPSYSLGQDQAAQNQLEMIDGVHPLQLAAYYDFMAHAIGFDSTEYSVTLPPFPEGDPKRAWDARIDAEQLGLLNTRYIVSHFPLEDQGLELVFDLSDYVYENTVYRPRAWVEPANAVQAWADVEHIEWSPNRIVVQATGPGRLVLSEVDYPGWSATLNGEPLESVPYEGLLRSANLPPGEHSVEWSYEPILTWIGLSAWGLLILALLVVRLQWWT